MPLSRLRLLLAAALLAASGAAAGAPTQQTARAPVAPAAQLEDYRAHRPKSVVELQPFRATARGAISDGHGRTGRATLIDLAPELGAWLLLELDWQDGAREGPYHLENPFPGHQHIRFLPEFRTGLVIESETGALRCPLWEDASATALAQARRSGRVYGRLCDGHLYLRNPTEGRKTALEWTTDFLRDYVWQGERITNFVRESFFRDAFLRTAETSRGATSSETTRPGFPAPARVDSPHRGERITPVELGIVLGDASGALEAGRWYAARAAPGVFVSALRPDLVDREVVAREGNRVSPLDAVESRALVYLVAFDLGAFDVGFAMGTEHPRPGWSDRVVEAMRDPDLPGPDGVDTWAPLVMTGMLNPEQVSRAVATFAGGFKRRHGAFRDPPLGTRNAGSHYGFLESGTILSVLQPDLATLIVWDDERVELRTWNEGDDARLWHVRHARQNGVPLLETDPLTGAPRAGALVRRWGAGNWSGSQEGRLRTLRSGLCLQESDAGRFLVYGYFSSVTPSAMALVFDAYGCRYAMHLDMNALEHTYLAVYGRAAGRLTVEHLIEGMSVLDKGEGEAVAPRFLAFPDNRDFFYLLRREP